jgi:phosphoglycerate dehydrogenase-like enzyme
MPKILIAEPMAQAGIELLQAQQGWNVVVSNPKEYAQHLADCDALLVRSAVQVDAACWSARRSCASSAAPAWAWTTSISTPPPRPACW